MCGDVLKPECFRCIANFCVSQHNCLFGKRKSIQRVHLKRSKVKFELCTVGYTILPAGAYAHNFTYFGKQGSLFARVTYATRSSENIIRTTSTQPHSPQPMYTNSYLMLDLRSRDQRRGYMMAAHVCWSKSLLLCSLDDTGGVLRKTIFRCPLCSKLCFLGFAK